MDSGQLSDIAYDFRYLALFTDHPLLLEGVPVGHEGLGGFSYTVFSRSMNDCVMCGHCCQKLNRRLWAWYDVEVAPEHDKILSGEVNLSGKRIPLKYFLSTLTQDCTMLKEGLCGIYDTRPWHCALSTPARIINRRGRDVVSIQHAGRNHLWPQCQATWGRTPYDESSRQFWCDILDLWDTLLEGIPGNRLPEIKPKLLSLIDAPENFFDISEGKNILRLESLLE